MDYTIIGNVVNASSRLESLTKYYEIDIILSNSVHEKVESTGESRLLDIVRVKGQKKPIHIYEAYRHEPDKIKEMKQSTSGQMKEAHTLYSNGKFKNSRTIYSELIKKVGKHSWYSDKCADPALNFFEGRCASLQKAKEPGFMGMDQWDGIYTFESK